MNLERYADLFPLHYGVYAGRPAIDLAFEVAADGSCLVDTWTEDSLSQHPPTRLGSFACRLPAETLQALAEWAANSRTIGEHDVQAFESVSRFLRKGGGPLQPVWADSQGLTVPDGDLADAAKAALSFPVSAIEVSTKLRDGEGPRLVISSIGSQPFALVLFERGSPNYSAHVWRYEAKSPDGAVFLTDEELEALVASGRIGEGVIGLDPGATVALPLPVESGAGATGGFSFWWAGKGPERRALSGTWSLPA